MVKSSPVVKILAAANTTPVYFIHPIFSNRSSKVGPMRGVKYVLNNWQVTKIKNLITFLNSRQISRTETGSPKFWYWARTWKRMVPNIWDAIFPRFFLGKSSSGNFAPVLQALNLLAECQNISKDCLQRSHLFFGWFVNNFFLQNLVKIYTQIKLAKLFWARQEKKLYKFFSKGRNLTE